jgi:hypothetical protein
MAWARSSEVKVVDGLEEGEVRAPCEAPEARLLAMRDLLGNEHGKEVAAAPRLLLGASRELAPDATRVGEVETFEQVVDGNVGRVHEKSSRCIASPSARTPWSMWCATYSAPKQRSRSARSVDATSAHSP